MGVLAVLELALQIRLASNSCSSCLCLSSARTKGMCRHHLFLFFLSGFLKQISLALEPVLKHTVDQNSEMCLSRPPECWC